MTIEQFARCLAQGTEQPCRRLVMKLRSRHALTL